MRNNPRLRRGFGRISAGVFQQTLEGAALAAANSEQLRELSDALTRWTPQTKWILAKVTASTAITGQSNRWEYDWEQVELTADGVQTKTGGFTSTDLGKALNLCELTNDGGTAGDKNEGPGWNVYDAPAGFDLRAISGGPVVMLWATYDTSSTFRWFFQLANVLDGTC